jgi:hypothetical protein
MIIEFQIQVAAFLAGQKAAMQAKKLCPPPPRTLGPVQVVIDRFEFGANSLRHNEETEFTIFYDFLGETTGMDVKGFQTQLAQDVVVYVTSLNDILAHPNGDPDIVVPVRGTLVMDLDLFAIEQEVYFQARFKRLELGPLPFLPPNFDPKIIPLPITIDQILQMVNEQVASLIPSPAIPMGLLSLLPVAPSKTQIVNAGLSVDGQLQRISLRVEVGGGSVSPDAPWINFFNGFLPDRLAGNEWSIFLPAPYIEQTIQTALDRAIADVKPPEVQIFVGAHYSNADAHASIMVDILGIYDLPDPLGKLEVHPHIPIRISVPGLNTIQIDVGLPDIQEFIERLIPQWVRVFISLTGPVGALLGALIDSFVSDVKDPDLPANVVRTSPENLRFTKHVPLPQILNGLSPRLKTLLALDDGIALAGPLNAQTFTTATLAISSHPFKLEPPAINCGGAGIELVALFAQSPDLFDILRAQIFVEYDGTLPVYLCSLTPINDPRGVFPVGSLRQDSPQANATITVHPPVPPPQYYAAPYPCDILVKTTAGMRLIRIAPPPILTKQDVDRLRDALLVELGNCEQLVDPWFSHHRGYNPLWSVDPAHEIDVLHLWQVEVKGISEGETVTLADSALQSLVTGRGRAGQPVKVSALLPPSATPAKELSILRGAASAPAAALAAKVDTKAQHQALDQRGIAVRQQLLLQVGSISLGQPCQRLVAARIHGRVCVVAVLNEAATAFDITNPRSVYRIDHWHTPGIRGALNWAGRLLLFGESGLTAIDETGGQTAAACGCEAEGVLDAAAGDGLLYAALPDALGVFSSRLCRVAEVAMDDCRSVLRIGNRLVAAVEGGLAVLDLHHPRKPKVHSTCADWRVSQLRYGPATEPGLFAAILEDGTARLLRLHEHRLDEAASYPARPWFVDAVRVGDLLVRIVGNDLELAQLGASETL